MGNGFRTIVEIFRLPASASSRTGLSKRGQAGDQGRPDFSAQAQMDELACPLHVNQAGGFQFLDVVGECCGRDSQGGEASAAAQGQVDAAIRSDDSGWVTGQIIQAAGGARL